MPNRETEIMYHADKHSTSTPNMSLFVTESVPWSVALRDMSVLKAVCVDLILLALFTVQHSVLAWTPVKQACQSVLGVLNRAMYCSTTALALQVINTIYYILTLYILL